MIWIFIIIIILFFVIIIHNGLKLHTATQVFLSEKSVALIRFRHNYLLLYDWLILEKNKINITKYFINCPYKTIAIYGYGPIGKTLKEDLDMHHIPVSYAIDRNAENIESDIPLYTWNDHWPMVDIVVITTNNLYEVKEKVSEEMPDCAVVMLKDILALLLKENDR